MPWRGGERQWPRGLAGSARAAVWSLEPGLGWQQWGEKKRYEKHYKSEISRMWRLAFVGDRIGCEAQVSVRKC